MSDKNFDRKKKNHEGGAHTAQTAENQREITESNEVNDDAVNRINAEYKDLRHSQQRLF
ncbi:hypothetical protein ACFO4N_03055 [Camelliibacillus cellulosilyticus]|uniref:YfhD-like protein n=1 Tax=Camelliibacillus cellulosilyticus TaxID=2174486 RepID=A0ABV9GLZ4_9BACL